jgi:UDP-N-acetylglucosamine/UDP-N-acetylgalactosamine diphosphorylase
LNQKTIQTILKDLSQEHLLPLILSWPKEAQDAAYAELKSIDRDVFAEERRLLKEEAFTSSIAPPRHTKRIDALSPLERERGLELLKAGKAACILVAGGQGTRFNASVPKGCVPLTAARHKTPFQLFAEKLRAASHLVKRPLEMAIMTSPLNHLETLSFFQEHKYFGCSPSQISFFSQEMLPLLTQQGDLFFESKGRLALGPDGNGAAIFALKQSGIAARWSQMGIQYATFVLVDNPLADPFDPLLIDAHSTSRVQATLKCIEREDPEERLGMVVEKEGNPVVIEYSEIPREAWDAKDTTGKLSFHVANISLFCFSLDFLEGAASKKLPLHKAFKRVDGQGTSGWKFERFIFDILPFASSTEILIYPRKICFAPLKNAHGKYSLEFVQKALIESDRENLARITGVPTPEACLETDVAFYYPTQEILDKWRGKKPPEIPYVEISAL